MLHVGNTSISFLRRYVPVLLLTRKKAKKKSLMPRRGRLYEQSSCGADLPNVTRQRKALAADLHAK